jgi:signal transduction histidine kinase
MVLQHVSAESLRYFFQRTHRGHLAARVVSAMAFSGACIAVSGWAAVPLAVGWLALAGLVERHILRRVRGFEAELDSADHTRWIAIARWLKAHSAILAAIYSLPAFVLAFAGPAPAALGVLLCITVMMNALSQHVLSRRMIFLTLPVPALGLILASYHVGLALFADYALFVALAMLIMTGQAVSLAREAADSYASLFAAKAEAVRQAQARREADAANEAKSQFLANMSHELRTPLNAIIGYSEIMRETALDDSRSQDVADTDRVLRASRHLLGLINDVLDVAKIEAGKMDILAAGFDPGRVIASAVEAVGPAMAARGNRLEVTIASDLGVVYSDAKRFQQCLLNLLSNAAKFTENGLVRVTALRTQDCLIVDVSDTGIGIAPSRLTAIFEPFVQADRDTAVKFGGTGLGLALTRQLARLLGGDVTATSKLGQGSCFRLSIATGAEIAMARAA